MNNLKIKSDKIIGYFGDTIKVPMEIFIQDLGWIIILREEVENVTDNWFISSKYNASTIEKYLLLWLRLLILHSLCLPLPLFAEEFPGQS